MAAASGQEREVQKSYWIEHTAELTVEAMMLDSKAADLDKEERPENENINGHYKNVKFMCADVTSPNLIFSPESVDLIFSNWLLMYLSDEEVKALVERMVIWLKVGGHIFFRESCFHQSGDHKRKNNPTHYRDPSFYTKVFRECHVNAGDGKSFELSLAGCKCIGAYVKNKKNQNQICWTWQKVTSKDDMEFQRFLDTVQYKCSGILRYERVFGQGFVSTGGLETTKEFVAMLDLQRGQKVLDVGCGIGGGNFYMAEKYDVHVVGIDLSINMISFALERAIGLKCAVEFEDKPALFRSFYKWLRPGGKVLISDYCKRAGPASKEFEGYIKQRGYDLHDVEAYGQMLRDAGFHEVVAEDRTEQFIKVLQKELDTVEKERESFIHEFSEQDYNEIVGGWKSKLIRSSSGEQRWGLFIAKKK